MKHPEYSTVPLYVVIVSRIGENSKEMYTSALFYKNKQEADDYAASILACDEFTLTKPAVTVIKCDLGCYDVQCAHVVPVEFGIKAHTKDFLITTTNK